MSYEPIDEQIVEALRIEPRASIVTLSQSLHAPRAVVAGRLHYLLSHETIRVVATVHPGFLGLDVIAHVSISTSGPVEELTGWIANWDSSFLVSITAGEYDVVAELRVGTHGQLQQTLDQLRSHPTVVRLNVVVYAEIVQGNVEHESYDDIEVDGTDRQILSALEDDGRLGWKALADRTGKSPSAIRSRVHRLLQSRIVRIIVVQQRGGGSRYVSAGAGLTLNGDSSQVLARLKKIEGVEFAATCIGRVDAVLTVRGVSPMAIDQALENVRAVQGVRAIATWFHLRSVKVDYIRGALVGSQKL